MTQAVHNEELVLASTHRSPARLCISDESSALAMVYLTDAQSKKRTPVSEERARRLVACWNALVGMSTEDIEAMALENKRKRQSLEADEACADFIGCGPVPHMHG